MGVDLLDDELNPVTVGCDIGQIHDNSALCVAEVIERETGKYRQGVPPQRAYVDGIGFFHKAVDAQPVMESHYTVRHLERVPLGTSYPDVAVRIADILCNPIFAHRQVRCLIDVTGVGRAIYDDVRREISARQEAQHVLIKPITFTSGMKYNRGTGMLAKAYLVSRLQSLLQRGVVHAPQTAETKALLEELRVYQIKVDQDGHDSYGAMSVGQHDDLATCLGLACLEDPFADRIRYAQWY